MASMATLKLNYTPNIFRTTIQPNSSKIHLSPCFNGSSWLSSKKYVLSSFHQTLHQQQKYYSVAENRDASVYVSEGGKIKDLIGYINTFLSTMDDGRISVSPYDTAWVALIKDINGRDCPQFPSSLEWIAQHQLADGSWGDEHFFCPDDRIQHTLACIVALRTWNIHPIKIEKGILFIKENVHKLEDTSAMHKLCGFEIVIPALLQRARKLGIDDLPYDSPVITEIHKSRDNKMKRIPKELMHKVPTSLLYSLEGLEELDWPKLMKLQAATGSFLCSPSSTAFAFMETGDQNCLRFITNTVQTFNGGAPTAYPVDLWARLWAVDRLQRLGISRYFGSQIKEMLSYVSRYWNKNGIFSGRDSNFSDIDDTSMGFRLLRLHGFDVDPSVFEHFRSGDNFACFAGQMLEAPSPVYNLLRASQLRFPGERILKDARDFAYNFLQENLAKNQLLDKWVISEHLADEIRTGLEMPYYATLPRVETRYYLQYYAGDNEIWNAKTLLRMEEISNNNYLELGRLDFQICQEQHQIEWSSMLQWYANCNVQEFGITRKHLLLAYFLSAATIFEPERSKERLTWAKSQIICRMIRFFFFQGTATIEQKTRFLKEFQSSNDPKNLKSDTMEQGFVNILLATLREFSDECKQQKNWSEWLVKLQQGGVSFWEDATLLATTLHSCAGGDTFNEDILSHHEFKTLSELTNKICQQLSQIHDRKASDIEEWRTAKSSMRDMEIEQDMQALVKIVLEESGSIDRNIKQTFLSVVKTYYYCAYYDAETIDIHIFRVLFEPVV